MSDVYDILIVGGGLVGSSLSLANLPFKIGMIEAVEPTIQTQFDYNARSLALSYKTRQILTELKVWQCLEVESMPIRQIHVSDKGHFGITRLKAKQANVDAFGYVVEMHHLMAAMQKALSEHSTADRICPAKLKAIHREQDHWKVTVDTDAGEKILTTTLLIGADGVRSTIREQLGIETTVSDHGQQAIVTNIGLTRDHQHIAYERFTATGPIAMLPMSHERSAAVLSVERERAESIMALSDDDFLALFQKEFGYRQGRFVKLGKRFTYPLKSVCAKEQVQAGLVLMGNAAHTLHPIAAQGFNLGVRDVMGLVDVLLQAHRAGESIGDLAVLKRYESQRMSDQQRIIRFTNGLASVFSNNFSPVSFARNAAMFSLDLLLPLKQRVMRMGMGLVE